MAGASRRPSCDLVLTRSLPEARYASSDDASFASFLARTEVLLLALPTIAATRHVLSAAALAHLRPHAVLVDVGCGDAIDTYALLDALDAQAPAGAALDLTSP
jgi:phosphoglycerate dehydrogenase-like enzyme